MGAGAGLYMYDVVVKGPRSLSHLLMSSCGQRQSVLQSLVEALGLHLMLTGALVIGY